MSAEQQFTSLKPPRLERAQTPPSPPTLPSAWQCTAILHPFSPPPQTGPVLDVPFFQLCVATIGYIEGIVLSVQITGLSHGTWWYKIQPGGTQLSTDKGKTWSTVDMGWTLPTRNWLQANATYFSTGYLNWMQAQQVDWWKQPVANSLATTWIWFNSGNASAGLPFRMMFGAPPPTPVKGDPQQLAVFQNFSFTYFPSFEATSTPVVDRWSPPNIPGFVGGNPDRLKLVEWRPHFAMTTYMTPVDSKSFPLPTMVLYQWLADGDYRELSDRAQSTVMSYEYNPQSGIDYQQALLFGVAPRSVQPPPQDAGNGFLYTKNNSTPDQCISFGFGEEPPSWARIRQVHGTIHACVSNNPALCPNQLVTIISVLFPPSTEYPQGRYLWTWYSPFPGSDGSHARPITFMESASTIAEGGTSLALADYYDYHETPRPFGPDPFVIPGACIVPPPNTRKAD
ncbi:hypothetical protein [Nannocystis radixulma]|uniref:Uncharacterized protein n=1 Tax=Nannocystis radixulma TaxID=2995305 RepID=A0ABT5B2D7_9BACT|nr:hypothetical protein [Nannocystis radixulma]MDC0668269.1 hypothetical protein [Nannocystis radixulma]